MKEKFTVNPPSIKTLGFYGAAGTTIDMGNKKQAKRRKT